MTLLELQTRFASAMLGQESAFPLELVLTDGMPATTRLDVYRNNIFASLKSVLKGMYPAVCRVVDERFFVYVAEEFIRARPPKRPCLSAYGSEFAEFLGTFQACDGLVYLPDLARLEWLLHRAAHAAEIAPLPTAALTEVAQSNLPNVVLRFAPSFGFLQSMWPVDHILRANRGGAADQTVIDLGTGPAYLEVCRIRDDVVFRVLPAGVFRFRAALHDGAPIHAAAWVALAADPQFDLSAAFAGLLREAAVVTFALPASTESP